jgi:outer membrane biogenesis lipoprotein LolB
MNMIRIFFFLALAALISSCGSTARTTKTASKDMTTDRLLKQLAKQRISPEWFEGKARINYSDDYMSMSASATVILQQDELVWMSVKKLGFEVARMKVTADSVYVLDRINNEYTIESLDYLSESYGLPAGLRELQDFILGNPVFIGTEVLQVQPLGPTYRLSGKNGRMKAEYLVGAEDYRLRKLSFMDQESEQEASALLSDYQLLDGQQYFSYLRNFALESKYSGTSEVELEFTKVAVNIPKQIRFDIPSRYTRAK